MKCVSQADVVSCDDVCVVFAIAEIKFSYLKYFMCSSKNTSWLFRNKKNKKWMDWILIHRLWYSVAVMFFLLPLCLKVKENWLIVRQRNGKHGNEAQNPHERGPGSHYAVVFCQKEWKIMFACTLVAIVVDAAVAKCFIKYLFSKVTLRNEKKHRENSPFQKHI